MGNNNQYDGKTLQEVIRKLLTFDQEALEYGMIDNILTGKKRE